MSKFKFGVGVECRVKKRHATMEFVRVEVVAGSAGEAEVKAKERLEGRGLVVGRVFRAERLGEATVADEMRDLGVPSLFEVAA